MLSQGDVTNDISEQNSYVPTFQPLDKIRVTEQDLEITINDSSVV